MPNSNEFVGAFTAYKDEDDYIPETNILLEVTEVNGENVELAFNAPVPGKPRCYIRFALTDLIGHIMPEPKK
jgi:hypothetical protein